MTNYNGKEVSNVSKVLSTNLQNEIEKRVNVALEQIIHKQRGEIMLEVKSMIRQKAVEIQRKAKDELKKELLKQLTDPLGRSLSQAMSRLHF